MAKNINIRKMRKAIAEAYHVDSTEAAGMVPLFMNMRKAA